MKYIFISCYLALSLSFTMPARAVLVPNPTIAGYPVSCTDFTGIPVYVNLVPQLGDVAQSTILPDGTRVITINGPAFNQLPPLLQLFTYAHECGHHMSGDIARNVYFHHDDMDREKTADRIGIRLLRKELGISLDDAKFIANFFVKNPPVPPYYLAGPLRAEWIVDCYNTKDNECGTANFAYKPSSSGENNTSSNDASNPKFCESLKTIIATSSSRFESLRANHDDVSSMSDSTVNPTGFESCTIWSHHGDTSSYMDCDGSRGMTFDIAKAQLQSCLSDWSSKSHSYGDGRRSGDFSSNTDSTHIRISEERGGTLSLDIDEGDE